MARRSRSNDGTPTSVSRVIPLDQGLLNKLMAHFGPEERERKKPGLYHGPRRANGSPVSPFSDDQVLAVRRMHAWLGMKPAAISEETGIAVGSVETILSYRNRVHLDPGMPPSLGAA